MSIILGIDPGNKRMGVAILNLKKDGIVSLNHAEVLFHENENNLKFNQYLNEGIYQLCDRFPLLLHTHRPDFIISEIIPVGRLGANTELNVAAITVCKTISWQWGLDWFDIAANTVKKIVTTDGRASKAKVKHEVVARFPHLETMNDELKKQQKLEGLSATGLAQDLYDAVAIAVAGAELHSQGKLVLENSELDEEDSELDFLGEDGQDER